MTDEEIRALREREIVRVRASWPYLEGVTSDTLALADEALRRGADATAFANESNDRRERIIRLEATLRALASEVAMRLPDAETWIPLIRARAALKETP